MKIEIIGLHIHAFIETYRSISYRRNDKEVVRKVRLKVPEAHYRASFKLEVDESLVLGGVYVDEQSFKWVCVNRHNFRTPTSELRSYVPNLPKDTIYFPKALTLVSSPARENSLAQ